MCFIRGLASEWGLHSLLRYRRSGELLPRLSTLTRVRRFFACKSEGRTLAVILCCTCLGVTSTGRYPALLPWEARTFLTCGLSAPAAAIIRLTYGLYHTMIQV